MGSGILKVGEPSSKGGRTSTGGRRTEESGKWDFQGGPTQELRGQEVYWSQKD